MRRWLRMWTLPVLAVVVMVVLIGWMLARRESGSETEAEPADESARSRFERRYAGVGD
jgi:cytochrome c-type biogenesis protein CcmH/NrfF